MGSFKEEGERTQVTFKGNGSLGSMQVKHAACNSWLLNISSNVAGCSTHVSNMLCKSS